MKFSKTILLSILTALTSTVVNADCSYEGGNYYCDQVSAVLYSNVGYSGTYKDVTNIDETSGECTQESKSFSGTNSPLDEELSVHFRGPVRLLQFGVYYPSSSSSSSSKKKRDADADCATTKHLHHAHKRDAATEVVQITKTVYVDSNGNLVTETGSTTSGEPTTLTPSSTGVSSAVVPVDTSSTNTPATSWDLTTTLLPSTNAGSTTSSSSVGTVSTSTSSSAAATSSSSSDDDDDSSSSDWKRSSYYTPGSTDNVIFLNTLGGKGSGVWSSAFGNSLSYAASNGVDASSSAQALDDVTLASDKEYVIFSGNSCDDGDDGCGYYRDGIPAYHGFGGSEKIFVFEFEMPTDSSSSGASNPDMPAIWLLNAKIPRTLQYGDSTCSCWSTGCGELDLFEILSEGDDRLISHLHDGQGSDGTQTGGGGSQDYFTRPTSGSFKGAVIFSSDKSIQIVQLDDDVDFSSGLSSSTVSKWKSVTGGTAVLSS